MYKDVTATCNNKVEIRNNCNITTGNVRLPYVQHLETTYCLSAERNWNSWLYSETEYKTETNRFSDRKKTLETKSTTTNTNKTITYASNFKNVTWHYVLQTAKQIILIIIICTIQCSITQIVNGTEVNIVNCFPN